MSDIEIEINDGELIESVALIDSSPERTVLDENQFESNSSKKLTPKTLCVEFKNNNTSTPNDSFESADSQFSGTVKRKVLRGKRKTRLTVSLPSPPPNSSGS